MIVLVISTILVGVLAIVLSQVIQNNQSPNNSSAFGFGEAVNKEYFDTFTERFKGIGCFGILSKPIVLGYANEGTTILKEYNFDINNLEPQSRNPVNCNISLDTDKSLELSVYTYNSNSAIDPDEETLFNRININLTNIDYQGEVKDSKLSTSGYFFYGADKDSPTSCRMNFFNKRNDFEYITVKVNGFKTTCKEQMLLAGEISYYLNESVNTLIDQIVLKINNDSKGN